MVACLIYGGLTVVGSVLVVGIFFSNEAGELFRDLGLDSVPVFVVAASLANIRLAATLVAGAIGIWRRRVWSRKVLLIGAVSLLIVTLISSIYTVFLINPYLDALLRTDAARTTEWIGILGAIAGFLLADSLLYVLLVHKHKWS